MHHALEPLIFFQRSACMVVFCGISHSPIVGGLTVFTEPRVDANPIENVFLQKPVAVMPLQR